MEVQQQRHQPLSSRDLTQESFQLQMGFPFPLLRANDLRLSLFIIRARSFLLSCTYRVHTQG